MLRREVLAHPERPLTGRSVSLRIAAFGALLISAALACGVRASAQLSGVDTQKAGNTGSSVVSATVKETVLSPTWRVFAGDDPNFADPDLDDRNWTVLPEGQSTPELTRKAFQRVWYRAHVRVPSDSHDLALYLLGFRSPEQVYVNGRMVDEWGKLGPGQGRIPDFRRMIFIPDTSLQEGQLTIAIRADVGPSRVLPLGADTILVLGPASVIDTERSLLAFRYFTSNTVQMVVEFFVLLLALSLAVVMRAEREYIALVTLLAVFLVEDGLFTWINAASLQMTPQLALAPCISSLENILLAELVLVMLHLRRTTTLKTLYWLAGVVSFLVWLTAVFTMYGHPIPTTLRTILGVVFDLTIDLPVMALGMFTFWFALARRSREAFLLSLALLIEGSLSVTIFLHSMHLSPDLHGTAIPITTFSIKWFEVSRIFLCLTLLLVLVLRTMRIARERGVVVSELNAARTVQLMLLDSSSVATPGFRIQSAYLPASEVGGDFYYLSPAADGSLLVVFGDVSGKGLRAAMTVSVIVGALRTESRREPAAVLNMLNRTLYGRIEGFVTCCAALLGYDGTLRLANAGNPAPYLNGTELAPPAELPLGLAPNTEYEEIADLVAAGYRLLFASDGVMEAAHPHSHQLFGFERTAALTPQNAQTIAQAAQHFGQTDDITVLAVEHLGPSL